MKILCQASIQTHRTAGSFKTLVAALAAAGLVDALRGEGPFTVFAPTDEAFAKLPKGTVESLLKPENKAKLTEIFTYSANRGMDYIFSMWSNQPLKHWAPLIVLKRKEKSVLSAVLSASVVLKPVVKTKDLPVGFLIRGKHQNC